MDVLIGLVIAIFVLVGVYVGYYASQVVPEEGESHSIEKELEIFNQETEMMQILQNPELKKYTI